MNEVLEEGRARLEESIKRSKALSAVKKASTTMLVGGIFAALFHPAGALAALAGVLGKAACAGAEKALETKTTPAERRPAEKAALLHYVAMLR